MSTNVEIMEVCLMKNLSIGDAELEIMKAVWRADEPIGSAAIGKAVEGKGWKRTTIATFLARLVEKGALAAEQRGKALYYTPLISDREYKKQRVSGIVKSLFDGSAKEMVAALFEGENFTDEDIEELKAVFDKKEK